MFPSPWSLCPASWCPRSSAEKPFPWCCASPMFLLALFAKLSSFCMFKYQFKCLFAQICCLPHHPKAHSVPSGLIVRQQCLTDVCTRTGSQLQRVLVLFHFPRQDLRLLPEQGHIYLQGYSNANRSLLRREEGASQKNKKPTSKWRQATIFLQEHLKKINASSYLNSWSQQAAML